MYQTDDHNDVQVLEDIAARLAADTGYAGHVDSSDVHRIHGHVALVQLTHSVMREALRSG